MSRLLETIKIVDGQICNIAYHNHRLNESRSALFDSHDSIDLKDHINIPMDKLIGLYKCRVLCREKIEEIEFVEYHKKSIMSIQSVKDDAINYAYKYEDRSELNRLHELRGDADDILIVRRGLVTDSYYCNVAFRTTDDQWITPITPLLRGTKRRQLLEEGVLSTGDIMLNNVADYRAICLFNSMIEFGEIELPIDAINTDLS